MGRDRNDQGRYADGIPPEAVLEVFDAREDRARPLTANDITEDMGIARRTAHNKLNDLVERGELETRKVGARGRVWWTPIPADREGFDVGDLEGDAETTLDDASAESGRERGVTPSEGSAGGSGPTPDTTREDASTPALDEALVGWEPPTEANAKSARAQTRRVAEYLREHVPKRFTKSELQDALAADSSLSPRIWWERHAQPGLMHLADAGLVEYRAGHHDYRWREDAEE